MSYVKHNFKKGEVLTAKQLNEMDDQIAINADNLGLRKYLPHNFKQGEQLLASQLNEMDEQIAKNARISSDYEELNSRYESVVELLQKIKEALVNNDVDQAISLLDTFILDSGILEG